MKKLFLSLLTLCLAMPFSAWADEHEDHNSGNAGDGEVYDGEEEDTSGKIVPSSVQLQYHILTEPSGTVGQEGYTNGTVELDAIYSNPENVGVISIPHEIQVVTIDASYQATVSLYTVTGIAANAFYDSATDTGNTVITSVTIPYTVTYIGNSAFRNCTNLTSLAITDTSGTPSQLKTIDAYAFEHPIGFFGADNSIVSLDLPASLATIGDYAFHRNSLQSLNLSEGLTSIGTYAFSDCNELEDLVLPSTVETILDYCFYICSSLTTVTMSGATTAGQSAFGNCPKLTSLVLTDAPEVIGGAEENVDPFNGDERDNITVYVPTGSAATYLASSWNTLVEDDDELHWNFNEIAISANAYSDSDEVYYATYYTDADGEFYTDVTTYIVIGDELTGTRDDTGVLDLQEVSGTLPEGAALLISSTVSGTTYYYHPYEVGVAQTISSNMLYGSHTSCTTYVPDANSDDYYFYKLSRNNAGDVGSVGFYFGAEGGAPYTTGGGKAWLAIPKSASPAKGYTFGGGEATGITAVESAAESARKGIYTIGGVRVNDMSKAGLYIVDGKKVIVK